MRDIQDELYERKQRVEKATADLIAALTPTPEAVKGALADLAGFVPEGGWMMRKRDNPYYSKGDERAPLMTEAATYSLCDKDSGRTLLAHFSALCRALSVDPEEIFTEVALRIAAQKAEQRQREEARERGRLRQAARLTGALPGEVPAHPTKEK